MPKPTARSLAPICLLALLPLTGLLVIALVSVSQCRREQPIPVTQDEPDEVPNSTALADELYAGIVLGSDVNECACLATGSGMGVSIPDASNPQELQFAAVPIFDDTPCFVKKFAFRQRVIVVWYDLDSNIMLAKQLIGLDR